MYACKRATSISIIEIEKAKANERLEPNQFLKIKINIRVKTKPNGEKIKGNNLLSKNVSKNLI